MAVDHQDERRGLPPGARKGPLLRFGWFWQILYILYSLEVGVFLVFLPWMRIWDNNYLLYLYPRLVPIVGNPFLKGAVLGLGIVNILIGIHEIVHLRQGSIGCLSR